MQVPLLQLDEFDTMIVSVIPPMSTPIRLTPSSRSCGVTGVGTINSPRTWGRTRCRLIRSTAPVNCALRCYLTPPAELHIHVHGTYISPRAKSTNHSTIRPIVTPLVDARLRRVSSSRNAYAKTSDRLRAKTPMKRVLMSQKADEMVPGEYCILKRRHGVCENDMIGFPP